MKGKKNRQYYQSKRRILKYKNPTEATINAMRIATQIIISSIEIARAQSVKIPKFPKGCL